jgi:hypothetical protein
VIRAPHVARRRQAVAIVATIVVPIVLVYGFGHRGVHAARNLLFPGAGLIDERPWIAAVLAAAAVAATVAWLRWGADWLVAASIVVAMVVSFVLTSPTAHTLAPPRIDRAAHEFPLVILVVTALSWARSVAGRVPGVRRLAARRAAQRKHLSVPDRSRCAALVALAGDDGAAMARDPAITLRARRIGLAARARRGGDPLRVDHAHARAALALNGGLDAAAAERFVRDAAHAPAGVPASEPGWVRPLDGTLAALALVRLGHHDAGTAWAEMLRGPLSLRRGHRPAWWWTPLGVSAGTAPDWEHAAATALARTAGWVGDDDWAALRARVLGAAARGAAAPHDDRLIASGRIWLAYVDDEQAARIVGRPTVGREPLAAALDAIARHTRAARECRPEGP